MAGAGMESASIASSRPLEPQHSLGWEKPEGAPIYLDYNATTPISPEVSAAMLPFLQGFGWGNPSSTHVFGEQAKSAVARARRQVAELIGCTEEEVFFTSGGTESNNWAIKGAVEAALAHLPPEHRNGPSFRLVTSAVEHPAVIEVMQHLQDSRGFDLRIVPVDSQGLVDPEAVVAAALGDGLVKPQNGLPKPQNGILKRQDAHPNLEMDEGRTPLRSDHPEENSDGVTAAVDSFREGNETAESSSAKMTESGEPKTFEDVRPQTSAANPPSTTGSGVQNQLAIRNGVSSLNGLWTDDSGEGIPEGSAKETPTTLVVSIMHSNNEVGSIQPIAEIGRALRRAGIVFHTDASQSVGKVPIRWDELEVDLMTIAGHKLYAPKGVSALIVRKGTRLSRLMHGAGHERGFRAGTENIMLIAGLGKACEVSGRDMARNVGHVTALRDQLLSKLQQNLASGFQGSKRFALKVNGPIDAALRLPSTLSISMSGVNGPQLLRDLAPRVACSAGSACHSGGVGSPVLAAMGVPPEFASCTLRLSVGRETTETEIDSAAECIAEAVKKQQSAAAQATAVPDNSFVSLFRQLSYSLGSPKKEG